MTKTHDPPGFDAANIERLARLGLALGGLGRALRGHPLADAWRFRAMVRGGLQAAAIAGLAVDPGRLLAAAAALPIAVLREDLGLPLALRHIQIQADWFDAARRAGDLTTLLARPPMPGEAAAPWARGYFGWAAEPLADCLTAMAAAPGGLAGTIAAVRVWVADGGDPMALTIALPIAIHAAGFSPLPLPGLAGRGLAADSRRRDRWIAGLLDEMTDSAAALARLLQGLDRARAGIAGALGAVLASSRLPEVAGLALASPAVATPLVVRHLTRLARRGGRLGRTSPGTLAGRRTGVSRAGAGKMLRALARSGWLVEITGSRSHKAYVLRDLADLGIDVTPARRRPQRRLRPEADDAPIVTPPLDPATERLAPVEIDFTEALSDLHMVESRIAALLAERGLRPRTHRTPVPDDGDDPVDTA